MATALPRTVLLSIIISLFVSPLGFNHCTKIWQENRWSNSARRTSQCSKNDEDSESSCESMESVSSYSTGYTTSVNTMERLSVTAMKERPTSSSALDDTKKKSVIFTDR
eukprot:GEMP01124353.1.p1 GENE.GEMP01124353.1~~GEMP01124353.1.p1  ORF type:complete len:109 (+),score=18.05 GEMP01124353.1:69-395(+)